MLYVCYVPCCKKWETKEQIKNILNDLELYKENIIGISFSHNSIGIKCAEELGKKMKLLNNLKRIDLNDCFVSRGKEELPKCLGYLLDAVADKNIEELNLSDNALGPEAISGLKKFFEKNKTLKILFLNNCGMGPIGTPKLMEIIKNNGNINLETLEAKQNKMECVGVKSIAEIFKTHKNLVHLNISFNEVFKDGIYELLKVLKDCDNLKYLNINGNSIGEKKQLNLIEVLKPFINNLVFLDLSDIGISKKEIAQKIIEILPTLQKMRYFYFSHIIDNIDNFKKGEKEGLQKLLLESLLKMENLKEFVIESNEINPKSELYKNYLKEFQKKDLYYYSFFDPEELEEDVEGDDLDYKDLED